MTRALLLILLVTSAVSAQALYLQSKIEGKNHKANAVFIESGLALACAHSVLHATSLKVNGIRAEVLSISDDLALLRIDKTITAKSPGLELSPFFEVRHRYIDVRTRQLRERYVTITEDSHANVTFENGMSGSGLYDKDENLVGIAEWTTGFFWNQVHILGFLESTIK